tara:strand:- start:401 stop:1372 length:972 start_codon:yes stop_codon:yes gene_type:complete
MEQESKINLDKCQARLLTNRNKQCSRKKAQNCIFCKTHDRMWKNKGVFLITNKPNIKAKYERDNNYRAEYNNYIIIKIQKMVRGFIVKTNISNRGICVYTRYKCTNIIDCLELEDISKIRNSEFYSYKDTDLNYWGFHTKTFHNLVKYKSKNPFNFQIIDDSFKEAFNKIKKNPKKPKKLKIISINKDFQLQQKCVDIFQKIDDLGSYTKCNWFLDLKLRSLKDLYYFIGDMWNYRLNLSGTDRKNYIKSDKLFVISYTDLKKYTNYYKTANIILSIFNRLLSEGKSSSDKSTAANWILSSLTLVNLDARTAYPWLYQAAYPT